MTPEQRITQIEQFLHYAAVDWPKERRSLTGQIAARCQRCVLSERLVPLTNGLCPFCSSNEKPVDDSSAKQDVSLMQKELDQIFKSYQQKSKGQYDALVLYSGGKDSALLLHKLTTEYPKLRLLALFIDNGFASSVAFQNIRYALEKIDVDLYTIRPKHSLFQKTFHHALLNRPKDGYPLGDRLDGELSFDISRNLAASLDIPLMIIGLSPDQVEKILNLSTFESPTKWEEEKDTMKEFGLEQLYTEQEKKYWWRSKAWPRERRPRVLYPLYAWRLSEPFIRSEVVRLGLINSGRDHPFVTNNDLIFVNIAADVMDRGYSGFEPGFAHMIRQGKADREHWLHIFEAAEYLTRKGQFLSECIDDSLAKLRLSRKDLRLP